MPVTDAPYAQLVLDADETLHGGLAHGKAYRAFVTRCECSTCEARRLGPIEGNRR